MNTIIVYGAGILCLLVSAFLGTAPDLDGDWYDGRFGNFWWRATHPGVVVPFLLGVSILALAVTGHIEG